MDLRGLRKVVKDEVIYAGGKLPPVMRIDLYLNQAGRAFLIDTRIRRSDDQALESTHNPEADTGHHTFATDAATIEVLNVYFKGDQLSLTTREELSVFIEDWKSSEDGEADCYFVANGRRVRIHPPVSLADSDDVTADLVLGWATDLTLSDGDPAGDGREIPEPYHMALAYWAANKIVPSKRLLDAYTELRDRALRAVADAHDDVIDKQPPRPAFPGQQVPSS